MSQRPDLGIATSVANTIGARPPSAEQLEDLDHYLSRPTLTKLLASAASGDPVAQAELRGHFQSSALHQSLMGIGITNSSVEAAAHVIRLIGADRVRATFTDAKNGLSAAKETLRTWVNDALKEPDPLADAPARHAPHREVGQSRIGNAAPASLPTDVPPPEADPPRGAVPDFVDAERGKVRQLRPEPSSDFDREPVSESPAPDPSGTEKRRYDNHTVYGRDQKGYTGLTFDRSPSKWDREVTTINLSLARARTQDLRKDGCDWDRAIVVMLTPHEVERLLAVLLRKTPTARFAGHGPDNKKWVEISESTDNWAGTFRVTLAHGSDMRSCTITHTDIGRVIAILNRCLADQMPGATPLSISQILDEVGYANTHARRREQENSQRRSARG